MAKKAENALLSFKFLATAGGLWFAWKSYKKKEELAEAQFLALRPSQPVTATTPLSIPTGQPLPSQQTIVMQAPQDAKLQEAQPTRPMDSLVVKGQALLDQFKKINI